MLRTITRVLVPALIAGAIGLYALLAVGSRRGIEYYYGR